MTPAPVPVIFRMIEGQVLALFPTLPYSCTGAEIMSYAHVGQHGAASPEMLQAGRPATPAEYAPLAAELRGIYEPAVPLRIVRRSPPWRVVSREFARHRGAYSGEGVQA